MVLSITINGTFNNKKEKNKKYKLRDTLDHVKITEYKTSTSLGTYLYHCEIDRKYLEKSKVVAMENFLFPFITILFINKKFSRISLTNWPLE